MNSSLRTTLCRGLTLVAAAASIVSTAEVNAATFPAGTLAAAQAGQGNFGTIKGKLVWGGEKPPAVKPLIAVGAATKDPTVCAAKKAIPDNKLPVDPSTLGVRYAFAYLVRPKGENPDAVKALVAKTASVVIDQANCEFLPYSTALHQDQTLIFKSTDPVNHNVHLTPFNNAPFNTILAPSGQIEKKLVAERRVIPLSCDIHPWMKGWVMVFDHPFFAVTGEDGSFEIKGVPAGTQSLVVWQEATGYVTKNAARGMEVTVKAGQTTDIGSVKLDPAKVKQ